MNGKFLFCSVFWGEHLRWPRDCIRFNDKQWPATHLIKPWNTLVCGMNESVSKLEHIQNGLLPIIAKPKQSSVNPEKSFMFCERLKYSHLVLCSAAAINGATTFIYCNKNSLVITFILSFIQLNRGTPLSFQPWIQRIQFLPTKKRIIDKALTPTVTNQASWRTSPIY